MDAMETMGDMDPNTSGLESSVKRRKVRKGTRSCWECKRRKVRCSLSTADSHVTTCVACRRRRTPCISQEFSEDYSPCSPSSASPTAPLVGHKDTVKASSPLLTPSSFDTSSLEEPQLIAGTNRLAHLSQKLYNALPSQHDINIICEVTSGCSMVIMQLHTRARHELELDEVQIKKQLADRPRSNVHPIILARYMLQLAVVAQDINDIARLSNLSERPQKMTDRLVETVNELVLTKESLVSTIDGLECLVLEGMYHTIYGNLRTAWLTFRRAISIGQLLCIDRPQPPHPLPIIDPRRKISSHHLWFRIVYLEVIYSMMLGLPQTITGTSMASYCSFTSSTTIEKLEQIHLEVASRTIDRDRRFNFAEDYELTRDIDNQLLQISRDMPSKFWLLVPPAVGSRTMSFNDIFDLYDVVVHYHLLNQVHLPYTLWLDSSDTRYEYSRNTCIQACREILTRFTILLNISQQSFFCQRIDYYVLLAAITLLLIHLDHHKRSSLPDCQKSAMVAHMLTPHQRLSDRAIMNQVLGLMERSAAVGFLDSQRKALNLLRCFLSIEADAALGQKYVVTTNMSHGPSHHDSHPHQQVQETEFFGPQADDAGVTVSLSLPYLGFIKISKPTAASPKFSHAVEPTDLPPPPATISQLSGQSDRQRSVHETEQFSLISFPHHVVNNEPSTGAENDWLSFQDIDLAFFDSLLRPGDDGSDGMFG